MLLLLQQGLGLSGMVIAKAFGEDLDHFTNHNPKDTKKLQPIPIKFRALAGVLQLLIEKGVLFMMDKDTMEPFWPVVFVGFKQKMEGKDS